MLNIQRIVDDAKCGAVVRAVRWPDGVRCRTGGEPRLPNEGLTLSKSIGNVTNGRPAGGNSMI